MKLSDLTKGTRVTFTTSDGLEINGTVKSYPLYSFVPVALDQVIMAEQITNYVHTSAIREIL